MGAASGKRLDWLLGKLAGERGQHYCLKISPVALIQPTHTEYSSGASKSSRRQKEVGLSEKALRIDPSLTKYGLCFPRFGRRVGRASDSRGLEISALSSDLLPAVKDPKCPFHVLYISALDSMEQVSNEGK